MNYTGAGGTLMGVGGVGMTMQDAQTAAGNSSLWLMWVLVMILGVAMLAIAFVRNRQDARTAGVAGNRSLMRRHNRK